jgi:hypothetical protein
MGGHLCNLDRGHAIFDVHAVYAAFAGTDVCGNLLFAPFGVVFFS